MHANTSKELMDFLQQKDLIVQGSMLWKLFCRKPYFVKFKFIILSYYCFKMRYIYIYIYIYIIRAGTRDNFLISPLGVKMAPSGEKLILIGEVLPRGEHLLNNVKQCQTMSNNVKQCQTMSNNVKQCQTMSNNFERCWTMLNNVKQCKTM
jgi:hypothetical protein